MTPRPPNPTEISGQSYQVQKTHNTLDLECQLFKNRMLTLYKALENQVTSTDNNKCFED